MKYLDEYRDPDAARSFVKAIHGLVTRPWALMEICGGHTHSIFRYGLDKLIHPGVEFIHGPGCPVCVLPIGRIDLAIRLALERGAAHVLGLLMPHLEAGQRMQLTRLTSSRSMPSLMGGQPAALTPLGHAA